MRKSNSIFKTAFVSEAGARLTNDDYFAYVEFDDYACYVLASGITDIESTTAAQDAVEHLILSFQEKPSMAKTTLMRYMRETNERLLSSRSSNRLKASVIMLVTDYEKFRYASAGNVRLRMYRNGRLFLQSSDMSLAKDMIDKGKSVTPLDRHEERNNLYGYLGKKESFYAEVSKAFKLADADIILIYSQGLWENVDEQEIDEIMSEATDEPQESVDMLEDVLLSRQPPDLKCYTMAAIFINKAYSDPERERKRLRYIKIACVVILILLIIAIIVYVFSRMHRKKVEELQNMMQITSNYMNDGNYGRAQESCKEALALAKELEYKKDEDDLRDDLMLLDSVVLADDLFNNRHYNSAYEEYLKAMKFSHATDEKVREYIQRRLDRIEDQLNMDQFMGLGDDLFQKGEFDAAEGMYNKAIERASALHDAEGRTKAFDALEQIYDKRAEIRKDADKQLEHKKQAAMSDAMKKGDALLAAGDLEGAQQAYLNARNMSDNIADRAATSEALNNVSAAREKKALEENTSVSALKERSEEADKLEQQGDDAFNAEDYLSAQMYYVMAIEKFNALKDEQRSAVIQQKYDAAKDKFLAGQNSKREAEALERTAREFYIDRNYAEAKSTAAQAKDIYNELGMKGKADEMDILIQQIATDKAITDALK